MTRKPKCQDAKWLLSIRKTKTQATAKGLLESTKVLGDPQTLSLTTKTLDLRNKNPTHPLLRIAARSRLGEQRILSPLTGPSL